MKPLILVARLIFGAWMLANAANYLFFSLWPLPAGHEPLAVQLMDALVHSRLFDVAMAIQLVAGALILAGFFVPLALCIVMPISTCALYWSAILDHQPVGAMLALVAFALNGVLMLAYIDYYRDALQRHAPSLNFETLFVNPNGRTPRGEFVPALLTLVAVIAFYVLLVGGRTGQWSLLVLVFPAFILHARRLHDMGYSAWLLLVPTALMVVAFAIWLKIVNFGAQLESILPAAALAVAAGFALWGCMAKSRASSAA
jgi:putative oxidoreductase